MSTKNNMRQVPKPFIKLLSSPYKKYFYDVNKGKIQEITSAMYGFLSMSGEKNDRLFLLEELESEYDALYDLGYLHSNPIKRIEHPMSDYLILYQDRNISSVTLQLTQNCNLRCKYCIYTVPSDRHQRQHSSRHMSWETAKKAIDFLWQHSVDSPKVTVGFYGGEPLLEKDLIKKCIDYSKKIFDGKALQFQMTTNATLLDEETLALFAKENMVLLISIDGPKEIHDKNRVFENGAGSYDLVIEKINLIKERYPQYLEQVSINMVIDPKNDFEKVMKITMPGGDLYGINTNSSFIVNDYIDYEEEISSDFKRKYDYTLFLAYMEMLKHIKQDELTPLVSGLESNTHKMKNLLNATRRMTETIAPGGPCIPGRRIMIDVNGNFYPCERVSETSEIMRIGSLEKGFDRQKCQAMLNIGKIEEQYCKECWAIEHCTICVRLCDGGSCFSNKKKRKYCAEAREYIYGTLLNIILLQEYELLKKGKL